MINTKRGAIEISFSWFFAIAAGIVIILLAVFISSKIMKSGQESVSARTGKEIGVLLNPLETEFESAQSTLISIPLETRIRNKCSSTDGIFGTQGIILDQKSFNKWTETKINVKFKNKYIFSEEIIEGKSFYIFSKPFNFPFKVVDLFYFIPTKESYCFIDAPTSVVEEISSLRNQSYIKTENCSQKDIKVCFGQGNCNISVLSDTTGNYVLKNQEKMYFNLVDGETSPLMYAAIFSDKSVYECQIKRIMFRLSELLILYSNKENFLESKGCGQNLGEDLLLLRERIASLDSSSKLAGLTDLIYQIELKNDVRVCRLW